MDAQFTWSELRRLAEDVLRLDCSARTLVHAEKMINVGPNEYSRSFYEAACQIMELKSMRFSLNAAVISVAGRVPAVEFIKFDIKWWDLDIVAVTELELSATAAVIDRFKLPSPDRALAHKISIKTATKEEQRLFALRYVDYKTRISNFDSLLCDFCSDTVRSKKELNALKYWIVKVSPTDGGYDVERPVLPPWRDTEYWDTDLDEWGYGDDFSPTFEPMSSFDIEPTAQLEHDVHKLANKLTTQQKLAYNDAVVASELIEEEELEVTTLDPDVFEDEELYAAQDAEKNRLLADAVNLPLPRITNHYSERTMKNFPILLSNATAMTAEELKEKEFGDNLLLEAMSYNSFNEELKACEKAMKRDPDGKLLDRAFSRLLDSQEKIEMAAHNKSESRLAIVSYTGSDLADTSSLLPQAHVSDVAGPSHTSPTAPVSLATTQLSVSCGKNKTGIPSTSKTLLTEQTATLATQMDPNAYSQLYAPHEIEEEWPELPSTKSVPGVQQQAPPSTAKTQPSKNVWVEKNKTRKTFMNVGIGCKLTHVQPSANKFFVDVNKAPTVQDIWGFSLLGQYVGHNPGHYLVNAMIKSWGVRTKYKIEEGWFIFTFESELDQQKVLIGGPYLIHGRPMLLKNIPDKFAFNRKDLALVPLWVRIYGLASRFWTPENLGGIASYVGCPMYMDPVTDGRKRNAYARVLVEINLAAPVTKKVPIKFSDGDKIEVNFLVENQPKFCTDCCSYGHESSGCQFLSKKASTVAKEAMKDTDSTPPEKGPVAQQNSQHTPFSDAENNIPVGANNNQTARLDMVLYRGGTQLQQRFDNGLSHGTDAIQTDFIGPEQSAEEGEIIDHATHQEGIAKATDSVVLAVVHSDITLVNKFVSLDEATTHTALSDDTGIVAPSTSNSEEEYNELTTNSELTKKGLVYNTEMDTEKQVATKHKATKDASSTLSNKLSNSNTWHTVGPNTRSRKKANKH